MAYGAGALSNTNGNQVVDNYTSTYTSLFTKVTNNGNTHVKVGDVLSYYSPDNHTAIVKDTSGLNGSGTGTITVIEQNASSTGQHTQTVTSWVIKNGVDDSSTNGDTVSYWLTPIHAWSDNSPSGTTNDSIYAMAASSTSNVWAAGYEKSSSTQPQPVTYFNSGSGWTKYLPPTRGTLVYQYLNGIASSSSSDAWTVGTQMPSSTQTLAYHWTGSSWAYVTSDNPGGSTHTNELLGVAYAGSDVFAVGDYWNAGGSQLPLIEKWNGTKFADQSPSLPSGAIDGKLYSVAFSSSTNGWAVGSVVKGTGPYTYPYVIYHYDGTNWTAQAVGPSSGGSLKSVTAVSGSEAWAVGSQGTSATPLIMHTTDGGTTWTEDTSFNGFYPSSATLASVSAGSATDVWIIGAGGGTSFAMHNLSYGWIQISTPSSATLTGVAVNSGDAWTGGYTGSGPSPVTFMYS